MVFVTAKCTLKISWSNLKPMIICQEASKDINEKQIIDKKQFLNARWNSIICL